MALITTTLLGLNLHYLVQSGSQPWNDVTIPDSCSVGNTTELLPAEMYLYGSTLNFVNEDVCDGYLYEEDESKFNIKVWIGMMITWVFCFLILTKGTASIQIINLVLTPLSFILMFACIAYYVSKDAEGLGRKLYFNYEEVPGLDRKYDINALFISSYNQVFFQTGLCVGIHYAYGSYNHIKKPIIQDTFGIAIVNFFFSLFSGFIVWAAIGYLVTVKN
jgi:SNF family Na+-dependent transporter